MSKTAHDIVDSLLEGNLVLACASCEKEFKVHNPEASHGYCRRHLIGMYRQMAVANPGKNYDAKIAELEARPGESFAPDMAKQQQPVA